MTALASDWRAAPPSYRAALVAGAGLLTASLLVGFAYTLFGGPRPRGITADPLAMARELLKEGQVARAGQEYEVAARLNPGDFRTHAEHARTLLRAGRRPEAIAAWGEALLLDPRDAEAWASLGEVCLEMGRYPQATLAFTRALDLRPDQAAVHNSLGIAYKLVGRYDEAVREFMLAVRVRPVPGLVANLRRAKADQAHAGRPGRP